MPSVRADKPRSYRWKQEDLDLIAVLRKHFAGPTGRDCPEIDVLRASLRALAEREKVIPKKSGKNS